ncbi:hypothetical protein ASE67_08845 [Sphingomonas sp. Leaf23]|uniref:hypothetical protein n=1 Tax=Sphingomonas sp. Leaf23 TaxID=1735689 RepID=UPI0006FB0BEA|nr:hypothetical protein [Sphingomonas sp. Leaf23]KQM85975.1 hypothetical protein ASE67_08845 [Sphingomonas sp. Leaf23]
MGRFFSFDARIGRLRLLTGIVVGLSIGWLGILILRETNGIATVLVGAVAGATIAKLVVEAGRRRRDMDATIAGPLSALAVGVVGIAGTMVYALGTGNDLPHYIALALFVVAWCGLLLRPGVAHANAHGTAPDLLAPSFGSARGGRGGVILAVLLVISGAAIGLGANLWLAALAQHRERAQTIAEHENESNATPDALEQAYREQAR